MGDRLEELHKQSINQSSNKSNNPLANELINQSADQLDQSVVHNEAINWFLYFDKFSRICKSIVIILLPDTGIKGCIGEYCLHCSNINTVSNENSGTTNNKKTFIIYHYLKQIHHIRK